MAVSLQVTPVTNSCNVRINLVLNNNIQEVLDPGEAKVLTVQFDTVRLINPPHLPVIRQQNPAAVVVVVPGNVGYFSQQGAAVLFQFAQPNGPQQTVQFT
jgi:hypothetical protein